MTNLVKRLLPLVLLALSACHQEAPALSNTSTPDATIKAAVAGLKSGDLKALVASQVPPADLARVRQEWKQEQAEKPVTEADRKQFAEMMANLTAPNAETALYQKLDPQLTKMEPELKTQLPGWVGLGRGIVTAAINENKELNEAQKQQALKSVDSLAHWAESVNFTDRESAKRAIAVLCQSARQANVKSLDELHQLDFDQSLDKGSIAFRGGKQVLATYGLSLDKVLDSVKTEIISEQGDNAKVRVTYQLLDTAISYETDMTRVDGRWYGKEMLEKLRRPKVAVSSGDGAPAAEGGGNKG
jgi:hypothetical protein